MASGLRARASEARAIQARWREGKSKRRVTSKDSLFHHHHHHPNFYDFFPRAIAPFTGRDAWTHLKSVEEEEMFYGKYRFKLMQIRLFDLEK